MLLSEPSVSSPQSQGTVLGNTAGQLPASGSCAIREMEGGGGRGLENQLVLSLK